MSWLPDWFNAMNKDEITQQIEARQRRLEEGKAYQQYMASLQPGQQSHYPTAGAQSVTSTGFFGQMPSSSEPLTPTAAKLSLTEKGVLVTARTGYTCAIVPMELLEELEGLLRMARLAGLVGADKDPAT